MKEKSYKKISLEDVFILPSMNVSRHQQKVSILRKTPFFGIFLLQHSRKGGKSIMPVGVIINSLAVLTGGFLELSW